MTYLSRWPVVCWSGRGSDGKFSAKRKIGIISAAVLSLLQIASAAIARDGIVATPAIIDNLDPHKTSASAASLFYLNVFDTLVSINPTPSDGRGRHVPALATSWIVSPDGMSIDFTLRDDVSFQNGDKLTADDVKFTIDRIMDPKTRNPFRTNDFASLAGADVVSPTRLHLRLNQPSIGILDALATHGAIVPMNYINKVGDEEFAKHPIGSGPYAVANFVQGDRVTFKSFDKYWGQQPYFQNLSWRAIPDINTRISLLASGEADAITEVPPSLINIVKSSGAQVGEFVGKNQRFLIINTLRGGPLADRRVRLALNLAIDRKAVVEAIFGADVPLLAGPLSFYHIGGDSVEPYPFDPQQAKKLLAEAGYPNGFSTELIYTPGHYIDDSEMLPILVSYWKNIGVTVNLKAAEYNQWLDLTNKKTFNGMVSFSKGAGVVVDSLSAFSRHVTCDGFYSAYCNKDLDALVKSAEGVVDEAKLKEIFSKAQRIAHDDAAQVFLFDQPAIMAWKSSLSWNAEYAAGDLSTNWLLLRGK